MPYSDRQVLDLVAQARDEWSKRHTRVQTIRDLRYGRDDVISTIPPELRATDFEYHSSELDDAVNELTAFLSAAGQTWVANPPRDRDQSKSDDIESVIGAVFGPNGKLEEESGGEVTFSVYQNQIENGHGIYKLTLKKDYPLRMPQRRYVDFTAKDGDYEENPDYEPRSRKDKREEQGKSRYRETDGSLGKRRDAFMEEEFAWQWRSVDPRNNGFFKVTHDGVTVLAGEFTSRSVTVLDDYDVSIENIEKGYVWLGDPSESGSSSRLVDTFEAWDDAYCYFGLVSKDRTDGKRAATVIRKYPHPYRRPPYFEAFGLVKNDAALEFRYDGAFGKMVSEIPLLNHLETMHYNAIYRGIFPLYYPVRDPAYRGADVPMNAEQMVGVSQADAQVTELPPGWKWEVMPTGTEPDLTAQLQGARERVEDSAIVGVLRGASPGAADSGAKISLLINAATRAISPFTRHHTAALQEAARMYLDVNKRLKVDTHLSHMEAGPSGRTLVRPLTLKAEDIVTTAVDLKLKIELPVDKAAKQVQGLTLINAKGASYETVAPEYFDVGDPHAERLRILREQRDPQIDDAAFQMANMRFVENAPAIFAEFFANAAPVEPPQRTVGGGPGGALGGAVAGLGRGEPASPSATQPTGVTGA